jgi:hypothetical protein
MVNTIVELINQSSAALNGRLSTREAISAAHHAPVAEAARSEAAARSSLALHTRLLDTDCGFNLLRAAAMG